MACGEVKRQAQSTNVADSEASQDEVCGTAEPTQEELENLDRALVNFANNTQPPARGQLLIIPVYVWVIRDGDLGAVSAAQVDSMIDTLNREVARAKFRFQLASRTEVTDHPEWYKMTARSSAELTAKRTLRMGHEGTLNIWTADPGENSSRNQLTGYAVRCSPDPDGGGAAACNPIRDGVVIAPWRVTTETAVHETGHWMGLLHVFEGGCSEPNDRVADTPQQARKGSGCPANADTCRAPGDDPISNFMNYGTCRTEFTAGQYDLLEVITLIGRDSTPLFNGDTLPD
jgi:hypothetical protein